MGSSPSELIVILMIMLLFFGGKRLRSLGSDLGRAIKGFKDEMSAENPHAQNKVSQDKDVGIVIDTEVKDENTVS